MTFLRSNHIKEFTSSYGMHARCPGTLKRSRKLARQLFLSVLTLLPAGGSSQLTQCNETASNAMMKTGVHSVIIGYIGYNDRKLKWGACFHTYFLILSVCTYHASIRLLGPTGIYSESFLSKQKCSLDLSLTKGDSQGTVSCILHCQCSIIPVSLAEVGQMVQ